MRLAYRAMVYSQVMLPDKPNAVEVLASLDESSRKLLETELEAIEALLIETGAGCASEYVHLADVIEDKDFEALSPTERLDFSDIAISCACTIGELSALTGRYMPFFDVLRPSARHPQPLRDHLRWLAACHLSFALILQGDVRSPALRELVARKSEVETGADIEAWHKHIRTLTDDERLHLLGPVDGLIAAISAQVDNLRAVLPKLVADGHVVAADSTPEALAELAARVEPLIYSNVAIELAIGRQRSQLLERPRAEYFIAFYEELADLCLVLLSLTRQPDEDRVLVLSSLLPAPEAFR